MMHDFQICEMAAPWRRLSGVALLGVLLSLIAGVNTARAQTPSSNPPAATRPLAPPPPTRAPHTPGFVVAKELPDGTNAPMDAEGNFIIGPTHNPAPEMILNTNVPQGNCLYSTHGIRRIGKIFPGIAREANTFWHARSCRPSQTYRDHQSSGPLHAARFSLCAETICPRHRRAVHRRGGRAGSFIVHGFG